MLFKFLADHPQTSAFADTGVPEDEGQYLQSVYLILILVACALDFDPRNSLNMGVMFFSKRASAAQIGITANKYGGPDKYGFKKSVHLTEKFPLNTRTDSRQLFSQWAQYWDLSKPYLVDKFPPNLLRMRFLQALFPNSDFIGSIRHPVAVSPAIQKWSKPDFRKCLDRRLDSLLKHWVVCCERMALYAQYIKIF